MLANVALSVLDDHFAEAWEAMGNSSSQRQARRRKGLATYRLVRYADDFVVVVSGTRAHAEGLRDEVAGVLRPMGLRLSEPKTGIVHIDEGLDFLGFRIQRHQKRGTGKRFVYTYPSKKALASIKAKVRTLTQGQRTSRSPSSSTGSTRRFEDGPTTSATASPRRPSTTYAPSPGDGWCAGSATRRTGHHGSSSADAISTDGGRRRARRSCSTLPA